MIDANEIAHLLEGHVVGTGTTSVEHIRAASDPQEGGLAILFSKNDLKLSSLVRADVVVGPPGTQNSFAKATVEVEQLKAAQLNKLLRYYRASRYYLTEHGNTSIQPDVYIGQHTKVGENCVFMPGVKILNAVSIGNNVSVHANTVIKEGTVIGDNVTIDSNCSIGNFSFEYMSGRYEKLSRVESVGRVIIEDNVEIGCNTTIDRGTLGETIIGAGTKIDNLVQIGHDVKLGKNCLIVSQVGIASHTEVGDDVIMQGQVGVAGHLKIGDRTIVQAKSGLSQSCPADSTLFGYPARNARDYLKSLAILNSLTRGTRSRRNVKTDD